MSRRMKVQTAEKGYLEVFTLSQTGDTWEEPWELLRGTPIGKLFSTVSRRVINQVLEGHSNAFVNALGISPAGALIKVKPPICRKKDPCPLYDASRCTVRTKKDLPWCFEPELLHADPRALTLAAEAIFYWRSQVYIVVVLEDHLHA